MLKTVWFDHGLSSVADAIVMAREDRLPGLRILASHRDRYAAALRLADEGLVEPGFETASESGTAACLAWCLEFCERHGVDAYAVQGKQRLLAPHVDAFAAIGTRLLLPAPADVLDTLDDKTRFHTGAVAAGLPMPWTCEVRDVNAFDAARAHLAACGLSACVKPPRGIFGAGYWRLDDDRGPFEALMRPDDRRIPSSVLRAALATASSPPREPRRLLVLEFLPGPEWSVDCLCDAGRVLAAVARLKLGRVQRLSADGPAIELARRTVETFGLSGLINVQLRAGEADPERDLRVLEVNARMSGGCLYTRASGVNLPWWHLALAIGARTPNEVPQARGGALVAPATIALEVERFTSP